MNRLDRLERELRLLQQAPTFPIYDPSNLPEDAVRGQIALGTDGSFNWFGGTDWHTQAGTPSIDDGAPQDVVDGQVAIGSDNSFHWRVNGTWYTAEFVDSDLQTPPSNVVKGQIAIGQDGTFHWYDGDTTSG